MPAIAVGLFVRGIRPAVLVSLVIGFCSGPSSILAGSQALSEGKDFDFSGS
jgi:hypothetical protein